ncbi:MAG: flagellar biosynthetic protein FliO [Kofleriaceae bacterium]|nr:flagellar biosynthetic protein FliO [Kofleriaceae bacterium]
MRKFLTICAVVSALLVATPSEASISSASIQIEQKDAGLTIHIADLQVADNDIGIRGDRLFIDLQQVSIRQRMKLEGDKTVSSVEIVGGRHPRLVVRIRHGRDKTKKIGLAATVENIDGGIVMHIPRWPLSRAPSMPIPALAPATTVTTAPPPVAPANVPLAAVAPATPTVLPAAVEQVVPAALGTIATKAAPSAKEQPPIPGVVRAEEKAEIAGKEPSEGSSTGLILGFGLLVAGAGVMLWKSRQKATESDDYENMRIVATKRLGGKSKIIWLSVANREMVIAVADSGTQLLSEWRRDEELLGVADVPIAKTMLNMPGRGQEIRPELPSTVELAAPALGRGSAPMPAVRREDVVSVLPESAPSIFPPILKKATSATQNASPSVEVARNGFGGGPMGGYRFQSALSKAQSMQDNTEGPVAAGDRIAQRAAEAIPAEKVNPQSPALAGLMRLRQQAPSVNDDVATHDDVADAEWARELLKATRDSVLQGAG